VVGAKWVGAAALAASAVLGALASGTAAPSAKPYHVRARPAGPNSIVVLWETSRAELGTVWFRPYAPEAALPPSAEPPISGWRAVREDAPRAEHRVTLRGLKPSTRYAYRVGNSTPESGELIEATAPARGTTQFARLPVLVVVYTPITYRDAQTPPANLPSELTAQDLAAIRQHMAQVRQFYWRNSGASLDLQISYAYLHRPMTADDDHVEPVFEKDFQEAAAQLGRKPEDFTGVIFLYGWDEYADPAKRSTLYRGQGFGGLTYGVDAPWRYKSIPHSWIHFHHNANITWTVTHEYHHQLDSLFDASGHPEYPFNHPDPHEPIGVFGEHFDVNAFILRSWPRPEWGSLKWGSLVVAPDADNDGLPDRADVPIDERSFGSSPHLADTDHDGLSDLREMMATSGIYVGLDEEQMGPIIRPAPRNPDADGDGIPDGRDPYPLYPANPNRPKATPRIDGVLSPGEWPAFASGHRGELSVSTYMAWDDGHLYFAARASRPVTLHLDVDAANNGWFAGSDNYRISVEPPASSGDKPKVDVAIFDWDKFYATPQVYVYWNRDKVKPQDLQVAASTANGAYGVELAVPRNEATGLLPRPGCVVNVKPSVSIPGEARNAFALFEPHQLFHCRLVASNAAGAR